jgi:predicted amidophosphoribosyltransferase
VTDDPLEGLEPQPLGFGRCAWCPYHDVGSVAICSACAERTMQPVPADRCQVCDQALSTPDAPCSNPVCNWADRQFEWNAAVAMRSGELKAAINSYKYGGRRSWSLIFGRVLAGFLHDQRDLFAGFGLVISSPTYVGPGGRDFDHTKLVLAEAARLDQTGLPFALDPPVLVKTGPTRPLVKLGWQERREVCEVDLPRVLQVPDPDRVDGWQVLVYDDVFTDGLLLNAVAKKLRQAGAAMVCGVTLARQPWGTP